MLWAPVQLSTVNAYIFVCFVLVAQPFESPPYVWGIHNPSRSCLPAQDTQFFQPYFYQEWKRHQMGMAEELAMFNPEDRRLWRGWVGEGNHWWRPRQIFEERQMKEGCGLRAEAEVGCGRGEIQGERESQGVAEGRVGQLQAHSPKWLPLYTSFFLY